MSRVHDAASPAAPTIAVSVILSAALKRRRPGRGEDPERHILGAGATLADLLAAVGIDPATDLTAAIDGELAGLDTPLRDGAEVLLLAPMEGGAAAAGEVTTRRVGGGAAVAAEAATGTD